MQNVEVKSPLGDRAAVELRLESLGARKAWTRRQKDTFFRVPRGWLKLREEEGRSPELIAYRRSTRETGPRASDYEVAQVQDPAVWLRLLGRVLDPHGVVEKERTLWRYRHTRIHLDRVDDLGEFVELETAVGDLLLEEAREETRELLRRLGLDASGLLAAPYRDLLAGRGA